MAVVGGLYVALDRGRGIEVKERGGENLSKNCWRLASRFVGPGGMVGETQEQERVLAR